MSLPEQIGRLRRLRRLGAGGFATVWLYHDDELDSDVAVKALADNWAQDADIRERFLAESRLLRRTASEHVVQVHDIGVTDDDTPYFVMTYADQGSVADLLVSGSAPTPAEVIDIVTQAASGLAALHAQDIVHRDIKPQNLLLATHPDGTRRVLVADLGVAKALTTDSGATMHVGTPAYAAPEQGDPDQPLDARADVHGLGAVAYALIAGRPPRATGGPPDPLTSIVAGLPETVDRVVRTALEPNREHRWPDVMSFARALEAAVRGTSMPVPMPAPPPPAPLPGASRRRFWVPGIATAAVVSALIVGLVVWLVVGTGAGGGSVSGEDAFEQAAVNYIEALRSTDCESELPRLPLADQEKAPAELCGADNLHWSLAQCIDPAGERRVEPIGDDRARVVFPGRGYVEMIRGADTMFEPGYMVGCLGETDPDQPGATPE